jgi:hypothetical protein
MDKSIKDALRNIKKEQARQIVQPATSLLREHVDAIGMVVTKWAMVEEMLGFAVSALMCDEIHVYRGIIIAQMDYRHRRDALKAYHSTPDDTAQTKSTLGGLIKETERLVKIRDLCSHSIWMRGRKADHIKPFGIKARGPVKFLGDHHNEPEYHSNDFYFAALEMSILYGEGEEFLDSVGVGPKAYFDALGSE